MQANDVPLNCIENLVTTMVAIPGSRCRVNIVIKQGNIYVASPPHLESIR